MCSAYSRKKAIAYAKEIADQHGCKYTMALIEGPYFRSILALATPFNVNLKDLRWEDVA